MILYLFSEMQANMKANPKAKIANNIPFNDIGLKNNIISAIKNDNIIKSKLAISLKKSYSTIQRYIRNNDIMLTTAAALEVLREELQVSDNELLNK